MRREPRSRRLLDDTDLLRSPITEEHAMTTTQDPVRNGVDTATLFATLER